MTEGTQGKPPSRPTSGAQLNFTLLAIPIVALLIWADAGRHLGFDWVAVMLIGGGVGWVEILGRYRYAPLRATLTFSAVCYVAINVAAAAAAYYLIPIFDEELGRATTRKAAVEKVLIAGFGALVFLRSSLFKFRVGDADIGVGPAALLDTLLLVADRGVDRREAVARAQDVSALVRRVEDPRRVAKMLTQYCLALMQNVDQNTQTTITEAIDKILDKTENDDSILIDLVALRLGVVVGPGVLEAAVVALGDRLAATAAAKSSKPASGPAAGPSAAPGAAPPAPPAPPTSPESVSKDAFAAELRAAGVPTPPSSSAAPPEPHPLT